MKEVDFKAYLSSKGSNPNEIVQNVEFIKSIEARLNQQVGKLTLEDLNASSLQSVIDDLIDSGANTYENFIILLRYAKATANNVIYTSIFEHLDGHEAMQNLAQQLGNYVGDELRDTVFEDLTLPPLGTSKREKARFAYRIMSRMEEIFGERHCRDILSDSLRDLPKEYYSQEKMDFLDTCAGDLDCYLALKGQKFLDTLLDHQRHGELFFGQEITEDVITFVKKNPEIGGGVREGHVIYETKIPYNTKAFLEATDPEMKRYHYCHCPWIKESLRKGALKVSATFCQCSAGFHKKPFEVIFETKLKAKVMQSVLKGDDQCRFAIYLPGQMEKVV